MSVLPRRSGIDLGGVGAHFVTPVLGDLRNELGSVVLAQEERRAPTLGARVVEDAQRAVRGERASRPTRQVLSSEVVLDVQDLDRSPVSGFVEDEVH